MASRGSRWNQPHVASRSVPPHWQQSLLQAIEACRLSPDGRSKAVGRLTINPRYRDRRFSVWPRPKNRRGRCCEPLEAVPTVASAGSRRASQPLRLRATFRTRSRYGHGCRSMPPFGMYRNSLECMCRKMSACPKSLWRSAALKRIESTDRSDDGRLICLGGIDRTRLSPSADAGRRSFSSADRSDEPSRPPQATPPAASARPVAPRTPPASRSI